MATYILHTNYNSAEVDNRFWLCGSDPNKTIAVYGDPIHGEAPLGLFDIYHAKESILKAKRVIAKRLGINFDDIETASYLEPWENK